MYNRSVVDLWSDAGCEDEAKHGWTSKDVKKKNPPRKKEEKEKQRRIDERDISEEEELKDTHTLTHAHTHTQKHHTRDCMYGGAATLYVRHSYSVHKP